MDIFNRNAFKVITGKFIVIDVLYLEELKSNIDIIKEDRIKECEALLFPYSSNIIGFYQAKENGSNTIRIEQINQIDVDDRDFYEVFSVESSFIVIIETSVLKKFLSLFEYDKFVDLLHFENELNIYMSSIRKEIGDTFLIKYLKEIKNNQSYALSGLFKINVLIEKN